MGGSSPNLHSGLRGGPALSANGGRQATISPH